MALKLSDVDYELPQEHIAQYPAESRELSRMLVLNRTTGEIVHTNFTDFPAYVRQSDIIVLNNTRVINARLMGRRDTGGKVEIFLLEDIGAGRFKVLIRPSRRIKEGEQINFGNSKRKARLLVKEKVGNIIEFLSTSNDIEEILEEIGVPPLPPYIKRKVEPLDNERYQTVYATKKGATAAPTAGLHFTERILKDIMAKGTKLACATLHVNYGTFAPVKTEKIINHKMYSENFELTEDSASKINDVKTKGGKVIAVGTTSSRVLETCAVSVHGSRFTVDGYRIKAKKGKTDLFIYPGYRFKMTDALLTNFHFPKSTLLMFVSAFAGKESIFKTYKEAIERKYRFFSYGDCMLII